MPKVLRIINRFNLGGPSYNAAYLTRYLEPEFETLLIGGIHDPTEESSEYILEDIGVSYEIIPEMGRAIRPGNDFKAYQKICEYIKSFKPDIIHTHAAKAGALGRMAGIRYKVPVIVHTFHGHVLESYFSPLKNGIFTAIERYLAKRTTGIIALSQVQKEDLVRILKIKEEEKIRVIPLGFDLSRFYQEQETKRLQFRNRFNIAGDEIAIGIIGRLVPVKNHELFLNAIKYLKEHTSVKFRAFIIGDGEKREALEKLAREKGILFSTPYVECNNAFLTFTSWIREMDIVMAGLDIIALTSLNEGTPVSLIEAQAANKPIVTTRVGGIENVVLPGKTALLSEIGDNETFYKNMVLLAENENLRIELSLPGRDHVSKNFDYLRLKNDISTLYLELLKKNCGT
ncbi:MAG: glycosyltransferase [Bacteroidales bacterium]